MPASAQGVTPQIIDLGMGLGIREVHDLRERLLAAIEAGPVVLDASAVERADSAGVQLLISLGRSLALRGEALAYHGVSKTLAEVARTLGLEAACRLPGAAGVDDGP